MAKLTRGRLKEMIREVVEEVLDDYLYEEEKTASRGRRRSSGLRIFKKAGRTLIGIAMIVVSVWVVYTVYKTGAYKTVLGGGQARFDQIMATAEAKFQPSEGAPQEVAVVEEEAGIFCQGGPSVDDSGSGQVTISPYGHRIKYAGLMAEKYSSDQVIRAIAEKLGAAGKGSLGAEEWYQVIKGLNPNVGPGAYIQIPCWAKAASLLSQYAHLPTVSETAAEAVVKPLEGVTPEAPAGTIGEIGGAPTPVPFPMKGDEAPAGMQVPPSPTPVQVAALLPTEAPAPTLAQAEISGVTFTAGSSGANVRSGPGKDYQRINGTGYLEPGSAAAIIGRNGTSTWFKLRLPNGDIGWSWQGVGTVQGDLASVPVTEGQVVASAPTAAPEVAKQAVAIAKGEPVAYAQSQKGIVIKDFKHLFTTFKAGTEVNIDGENADNYVLGGPPGSFAAFAVPKNYISCQNCGSAVVMQPSGIAKKAATPVATQEQKKEGSYSEPAVVLRANQAQILNFEGQDWIVRCDDGQTVRIHKEDQIPRNERSPVSTGDVIQKYNNGLWGPPGAQVTAESRQKAEAATIKRNAPWISNIVWHYEPSTTIDVMVEQVQKGDLVKLIRITPGFLWDNEQEVTSKEATDWYVIFHGVQLGVDSGEVRFKAKVGSVESKPFVVTVPTSQKVISTPTTVSRNPTATPAPTPTPIPAVSAPTPLPEERLPTPEPVTEECLVWSDGQCRPWQYAFSIAELKPGATDEAQILSVEGGDWHVLFITEGEKLTSFYIRKEQQKPNLVLYPGRTVRKHEDGLWGP